MIPRGSYNDLVFSRAIPSPSTASTPFRRSATANHTKAGIGGGIEERVGNIAGGGERVQRRGRAVERVVAGELVPEDGEVGGIVGLKAKRLFR